MNSMQKLKLLNNQLKNNLLYGHKNPTLNCGLLLGNMNSPASYSSLVPSPFAHWDFSDLTTITKDGANRVSQVNDKSVNAHHLVQATGGNQPLWVDNGQNGLDVIDFISSRFMKTSSAWPAISQPFTVFVVQKNAPIADDFRVSLDSHGATNRFLFYRQNNANFNRYIWSNESVNIVAETTEYTANAWQVWSLVADGVSSKIRVNGVDIETVNLGTTQFAGITVGAQFDNTTFGLNIIGEIIIYNQTLSDSFRNLKESSLLAKWIP